MLRKIFGPRRHEVTGEWRRLHKGELYLGDHIKNEMGGTRSTDGSQERCIRGFGGET